MFWRIGMLTLPGYCKAHGPASQNSALGLEHGTSYTQRIWTERRSGLIECGPFWESSSILKSIHTFSECLDAAISDYLILKWTPASWETHRIQHQLLLVFYPPIFCQLCSITVVLSECVSILEPIHSFSGCLGAELLCHLIETRDHRFMRNPE
jgi:hypothetical protein